MTADQGHVVAPDDGGPYDTCERCGLPIRQDACDRGLVTMLTGNPECYGKDAR